MKFAKYTLEVPLSAPNVVVLGELGLYPIWFFNKSQCCEILDKDNWTIVPQIQSNPNFNSWDSKLLRILDALSIENHMDIPPISHIIERLAIEDLYLEKLTAELARPVARNSRVRTYFGHMQFLQVFSMNPI